MTDNNHRPK